TQQVYQSYCMRCQQVWREMVQLTKLTNVFPRRQTFIQTSIVGQYTQPLTDAIRLLRHIHTVHQNFSAAGLKESVNQPHQGCFACTVNPKQAGNFTVVQGEADILERFHLAELFADMLNLNHGCYLPHSSFAVQPSDRGAAVE